jgi:hypothetical protein
MCREDISPAPPFFTSALASNLIQFKPGERALGTPWVGPRNGLEVLEERKILPLPEFELLSSNPQLAAIPIGLSRHLTYIVTNVKYVILI